MPRIKGYKVPEDVRKKISNTLMGHKLSKETIQKMSKSLTGRKLSEETKKKMSLFQRGKKLSNEHRLKLSESHKGNKNPMFGKKMSDTTKIKLSNSHKRDKHWNWQGGKSIEEYAVDWTETLRKSIRERDKYSCKICNATQGDTAFSIHHIDFNKRNCNPNNLITLCKKCHGKTNYNKEIWKLYFNTYLQIED